MLTWKVRSVIQNTLRLLRSFQRPKVGGVKYYHDHGHLMCTPFTFQNIPDRYVKSLNIELQFLAKVFRFHMKSAGFHEIRMKSTPNLVKSEEFLLKHLISW